MKKFGVLAIVLVMAVGSVFAANPVGDSLTVNGTVNPKLVASISSAAVTIVLDGDGSASSTSPETTMNIKANKKVWTVSFDSLNNGNLVNGSLSIPYLVRATTAWTNTSMTNGLSSPVNPEGATIAVSDGGKTPVEGEDFTLAFSVASQDAGTTLYEAGSYTDTLTVSFSVN